MNQDPQHLAPPAEAPAWERLSPLSLVLRGGLVLVAAVGWFISQFVDNVLRSAGGRVPRGLEDGGDGVLSGLLGHPWIALGLLLAVLAAVAGGAWLNWRFTRFRISRGHVELRKGWLFREQRQVPMERIQAVEIGRPLLAQLLGLAQVVVQSAGGKDSNVTLAFLPLARAQDVRDRIQRAAASSRQGPAHVPPPSPLLPVPVPAPRPAAATPETGPDGIPAPPGDASGIPPVPSRAEARAAPGAGRLPGDLLGLAPDSGRPVLTVPNARLLAATLLHSSVVWLVIGGAAWIGGGYALSSVMGSRAGFLGSLPAMLPALVALLSGRVKELLKHGNFSMTDHGEAVRVLHGLTDHRTTTVPLHRVQAVELVQPLWWRTFGWWRARVNVAGVHGEGNDLTNETVVLPVGTFEQAADVLTLLDPRVDPAAVTVAAFGEGGEPDWDGPPRSARWFHPWSWRRRGYAVSGHGLLIRSGRWTRRVVSVPHARIQSLTLDQGPIDRALDLASVHLVSTPGPVSPQVEHLSLGQAERLLATESARSAAARGGAPTPCATPSDSGGLSSVSTTASRDGRS